MVIIFKQCTLDLNNPKSQESYLQFDIITDFSRGWYRLYVISTKFWCNRHKFSVHCLWQKLVHSESCGGNKMEIVHSEISKSVATATIFSLSS